MLNQDSGKRYYMIPAVIIAISMLAGIVMGTLHIGFVPGTLAFGLQVAAYTIVSLAVFIFFSLVWIGSESLGLTLLHVTAAAAATTAISFAWILYMPLGGIIRMIVVLCLYAAILAKLADIEWGEALLVGLTTNVIFFIIAFMLLSGGGA